MLVSWIIDFLRPLLPHVERFRTRSITLEWLLLYTPHGLPSTNYVMLCKICRVWNFCYAILVYQYPEKGCFSSNQWSSLAISEYNMNICSCTKKDFRPSRQFWDFHANPNIKDQVALPLGLQSFHIEEVILFLGSKNNYWSICRKIYRMPIFIHFRKNFRFTPS
jgi:hypothetical protein